MNKFTVKTEDHVGTRCVREYFGDYPEIALDFRPLVSGSGVFSLAYNSSEIDEKTLLREFQFFVEEYGLDFKKSGVTVIVGKRNSKFKKNPNKELHMYWGEWRQVVLCSPTIQGPHTGDEKKVTCAKCKKYLKEMDEEFIDNPAIGKHPDFFTVESNLWKDLEELEPEELVKLPIDAFSDKEFNSLDYELQRQIVENDSEEMEKIKAIVDVFPIPDKKQYIDNYEYDGEREYFHNTILHSSRFIDRLAVSLIKEALDKFGPATADKKLEIKDAVNELVRDTNLWRDETSDSPDDGEQEYSIKISEESFAVSHHDFDALVDELTVPDISLEIVCEKLKDISDGTIDIDSEELRKKSYITYSYDHDLYVNFSFDETAFWEEMANNIDLEPEEAEVARPPEERVVFKFKDGFYVVDLLSTELAEEGKQQGICVGRPDMGYTAAVRRGETKIFSLRSPNGKPKFTIEATLDDDGNITTIDQVKGKANRLPGFDPGKTGDSKIKLEEVEKAVQFVESIGIDPKKVSDLRPALAMLEGIPLRKNPDSSGPCVDDDCSWCRRSF